jgi:hypothetical protein
MKKTILLVILVILAIALAGCAKKEASKYAKPSETIQETTVGEEKKSQKVESSESKFEEIKKNIVPNVVKVVKEGNETKEYIDITCEKFYELFGRPEGLTSVQRDALDDYFEKYYKERYVVWTCEVKDVKCINNLCRLYLKCRGVSEYRMEIWADFYGENLKSQREKLLRLNEGDLVTVEGKFSDKRSTDAVAFLGELVVVLSNCKLR